jgi:hypothetical protein
MSPMSLERLAFRTNLSTAAQAVLAALSSDVPRWGIGPEYCDSLNSSLLSRRKDGTSSVK